MKERVELYKKLIQPGDLCFDVGAHKGDCTKDMLIAGAGKVHAFEPQQVLVEHLRRRFPDRPDVIIQPFAADDTSKAELQMRICTRARTISTLDEVWTTGDYGKKFEWNETETVPTIRLRDVITKLRRTPKFIKIDAEGWDRHVIKGLRRLPRYLCFEWKDQFFNYAEEALANIMKLTQGRWMACNWTAKQEYVFRRKNWVGIKKLVDEIKVSKESWGDIYVKTS